MAKQMIDVEFIRMGFVNFSFGRLSKWFKGRFMSWVKANPLRIGLPGQPEYHECLQLSLAEDTEYFAAAFIPRIGLSKAISSPRSADNEYTPAADMVYLVASSGKPKFYFIYNMSSLPTFMPKELHREKENEEEDYLTSFLLSEMRIYEVKPKPTKRNAPAGWLIK